VTCSIPAAGTEDACVIMQVCWSVMHLHYSNDRPSALIRFALHGELNGQLVKAHSIIVNDELETRRLEA